MRRVAVGPVTALLLATTASLAAEIKVNGANITVEGPIKRGDYEAFYLKAITLTKATITLDSPGGEVASALKIGEMIRLNKWNTAVEHTCTSACGFIFLAGTKRTLSSNAKLGFHAVYNAETRKESGVGNAVVGVYLAKLGFDYKVAEFVAKDGPADISYLTPANAKALGIDIQVVDLGMPAPTLAQVTTQVPATYSTRSLQPPEAWHIQETQPNPWPIDPKPLNDLLKQLKSPRETR